MPEKTTKYNIFKFRYNRDLDNSNLRKIKHSITLNNMLEFRPILVDSEMYVIDGQHRLEAAKQLNIPIFYEINCDATDMDILLLNENQKKWGYIDYVKYYMEHGNPHYIRLMECIKNCNMSVPRAIAILGFSRGGAMEKKIKSGTFVMPPNQDFTKNIDFFENFKDFIKVRQKSPYLWLENTKIIVALNKMKKLKGFEEEVFFKKLELSVDRFGPRRTLEEFFNLFLEIYNYKSKIKLDPEILNDDDEGEE